MDNKEKTEQTNACPKQKIIITVQHTEAEHHLNGRIGAWQDWELTERGREQAFMIGEWLLYEDCRSGFCMYVSPQIRARQTADEINRTLGITPVVRDELREVNAGQGNGQTREWYREHEAPRGAVFDPDYKPFPDADSDRELWDRIYPFYLEIRDNDEERILIVSHGTTLSFLQSMLLGHTVYDRSRFRFSGRSGSISKFTIDPGGRVTGEYINMRIY